MDQLTTETLLAIKADTGYLRAQYEALGGPEGRVTKLEAREDRRETREWIKAAIVTPIILALQAGLRHLGVHV